MFSNGSLPHRRSQIERLWDNSAFDNVEKIKPWFGGTWNKISQKYQSDYDDYIIKNITGRQGFNSSVRRTRQDKKSLLIINLLKSKAFSYICFDAYESYGMTLAY